MHSDRWTINFRQETAAFFSNIYKFEEDICLWNAELHSVFFLGGGGFGKICPVVVYHI